MNGHTLLRIIQTVRYLKFKQIYYQLRYRIVPPPRVLFKPDRETLAASPWVSSDAPPWNSPLADAVRVSFARNADSAREFTFIGQSHTFRDKIDWNYPGLGKLWVYNLNYFEYLQSPACDLKQGMGLISDFIEQSSTLKDGLEPYPTSLRIINWAKFMIKHQVTDERFAQALQWQCRLLSMRLEYHLMGNHLLENGFALLIGGCFLQHPSFYKAGQRLVREELRKQILPDGGHFEQSPMYHQILLYRLLDAIYLVEQAAQDPAFAEELRQYARAMLGWLVNLTFSNGQVPCFNDTTPGIAPATGQLISYGADLGVDPVTRPLGISGFRMWKKGAAEVCLSVGNTLASYQPGHRHADTFSFCLTINTLPVIVDMGISTYEKNARRQLERSTPSHNTVSLGQANSSDVWGGFRLGRRACVGKLIEEGYFICANHDGYRSKGVIHQRTFDWREEELLISDLLRGTKRDVDAVSRLHFHPDCDVELHGERVIINGKHVIYAQGFTGLVLEPYEYCFGYGNRTIAVRVTGRFNKNAKWVIKSNYI